MVIPELYLTRVCFLHLTAWSKWHLQLVSEELPNQDELQVEEDDETATLEIRTPTPIDDQPNFGEEIQKVPADKKSKLPRKRSYSANPGMLRRESTEMEFETYDIRRNRISNQAFRFGQFAVS